MKSLAEVIACFPEEVQKMFDFSNATYKGSLKPITGIICPKHGVFQQYPAQLRKHGALCPKCGAEQRSKSSRLRPEEFIARAEKVHPNRFSYEKTKYEKMTKKVTVTCPVHGDFVISPIKLVHSGQGCPRCGEELRGRQKDIPKARARSAAAKRNKFKYLFEKRARKVHGDVYDYSKHGYSKARDKVTIICPKHGPFKQAVYHHLSGQGCPSCNNAKSAPEDYLANLLSIFTTVEQRDRTILRPKELDIYLPKHSIAVEYCGMYWHSHKNKEEERKDKHRHFNKYSMCKEQGIRLITIYEAEWLAKKRVITRLLRNVIGKSKGRLMARKCSLEKVSNAQAREFFDQYHPQGGLGRGENYALLWKGKIVACMRFTFGGNDRGRSASKATWTLSRYATRINVAGGASRLFQAFLKEHDVEKVKSFSDNRYFEGGMYEKLGFVLEEEVPPDYMVWSPKIGLRPKPHYQRRMLPKRLEEHGLGIHFDPKTDPRTEADMTYLMGAARIYDCGKKRWVWTRANASGIKESDNRGN